MNKTNAAIDTLFVIHHSHTDIGFTHDQPVAWEIHRRFLDRAVELAERDLGNEGPDAFRWTAETLAPVIRWLAHSSPRQIDRFLKVVYAGKIEVAAMFLHNIPLTDTRAQIEMLQHVGKLRGEYGIPIRHAISCDINGHNWPLADALLDAGIESLTMAINEYYGGAPAPCPGVFRWQAPSLRELPVLNGWIYTTGNLSGLSELLNGFGHDKTHLPKRDAIARRIEKFSRELPKLEEKLAAAGWPHRIAPMQCVHPFGDNAPPDSTLGTFVTEWNASGRTPQLRLATLSTWWDALKSSPSPLPIVSGDWTDHWSFGSGAAARETAIAKTAQLRLQSAEMILSVLPSVGSQVMCDGKGADGWSALVPQHRAQAWESLHLWNEHTFEADSSSYDPDRSDSASQYIHKMREAWNLHSLGKLLLRDAVAELSRHVCRPENECLLAFNPLPWPRILSGEIPDSASLPRGCGDDPIASRHFQDHDSEASFRFLPLEVPAFGYATITERQLTKTDPKKIHSGTTIGNAFHKLTFDSHQGGLVSWASADGPREWLDKKSAWRAGTLIQEVPTQLPGANVRRIFSDHTISAEWQGTREATSHVLEHLCEEFPDGQRITQKLAFSNPNDSVRSVVVRTFLPNHAPWIEFEVKYLAGLNADPEAYYFPLPFALDRPAVRFDAGGQAIQVGRDQIPGTNRDYFMAQKWCDLQDPTGGVIISTSINPMVMLGGFHFRKMRPDHALNDGLFLGWIANNYWDCNYPARQPGVVKAKYRVLPRTGDLAESDAHRFGLEAATDPVFHNLFEPPVDDPQLPARASLLNLPAPPVLVLEMSPAWTHASGRESALTLRLLNASDSPQSAAIGSGALKIQAASECDFFGKPLHGLALQGGDVRLEIPARRTAVIQIETDSLT